MMNNLMDSSSMGLLQKVAAFGERRHEVLSKNLAHIETPNYKTRDLPVAEFERALASAVRAHREAASGSRASVMTPTAVSSAQGAAVSGAVSTSIPDLDSLFPEQLFREVESVPGNLTFQDGGNRSVEREFMNLRKNLMMQQFAVQLMTSQFGMLQAVISERA